MQDEKVWCIRDRITGRVVRSGPYVHEAAVAVQRELDRQERYDRMDLYVTQIRPAVAVKPC